MQAIAVVTVLVVATISLAWMARYHVVDRPDDDGDEPMGPHATINITGDETWAGETGFMSRGVVVRDGGSLTIRDCDLAVTVEDIVFLEDSWFRVEAGGSLAIVNSTIDLVAHPGLSDSVVLNTHGWDWTQDVSRIVNLENTDDPVLSFYVAWRQTTRLGVFVQPSPDEGLTLIRTLVPEQSGPGIWEHYDVSLTEFAGEVVRVGIAIIPTNPANVLIIGDLQVTDGGEPLVGDIFPGSYRYFGYWTPPRYGLTDWRYSGDWWGEYALFEVNGTMTVEGSELTADDTVPRDRRDNFMYSKLLKDLWARDEPIMALNAFQGGHIGAFGGSVSIVDSELRNLPIVLINATVELDDDRLMGSTDLVSMYQTRGTVKDCTLVSSPIPPTGVPSLQRHGWEPERDLWAVGVEGVPPNGSLRVEGCVFRGSEIALDLLMTEVDVMDCTFEDVSKVEIWDHAPASDTLIHGLPGSSTFEDQGRPVYVQTWTHSLEFEKPDGEEYHGYWQDDISLVVPGLDLRGLVWEQDGFLLAAPELLMTADGTREEPDEAVVEIDEGWDWSEKITFTIDLAVVNHTYVLTDEYHRRPEWTHFVSSYYGDTHIYPTDRAGGVIIPLYVDWLYPTVGVSLELTISVDDGKPTTIDLLRELERGRYGSWWYEYELTLPPGCTNITMEVASTNHQLDERWVYWNTTFRALRVTNDMGTGDLGGRIEGPGWWLVIDPGVEVALEIDDLPVDPWWNDYEVNLTMFPGSSVALTDSSPTARPPIMMVAEGYGNVSIHDVMSEGFSLDAFGCDLVIEDASFANFGLSLMDANLTARRSDCGEFEYIYIIFTNLTFDGCGLSYSEIPANIYLDNSSLEILDCDLAYSGPPGLESNVTMRIIGNSTIDIVRSRFHEAFALIDGLNDPDSVVNVIDSTFEGDGCVLWIEPVLDFWDRSPDEFLVGSGINRFDGNTFSGKDAGLVVSGVFTTSAFPYNNFTDGARMYARYQPTFFDVENWGCAFAFVDGDVAITREVLGGRVTGSIYEVFVDVTDDPTRIEDPGTVTVMVLTTYWDDPDDLVGFIHVDPSEASQTVQVPDWGQFGALLHEFLNPPRAV